MGVAMTAPVDATPGFKVPRKTYRIRFEPGHEYHGLEVTVRSVSLGRFMDLAGLLDKAQDMRSMSLAQVRELRPLFEMFATLITSWNLIDDNGELLPATADTLMDLDTDLMVLLITKWTEAMAAVPAPLPSKSNGGGPSAAPTIPMEPLPSSPPSLSAPN